MEYGKELLFFSTIAYLSQAIIYTSSSTEYNVKAGLLGMIFVFFAQSLLRPYKSPFPRVRDIWCRVCARGGLLYLVLLIFLLFQNASDARQIPVFLEPSYGKELPLKYENYTRDCAFRFENIYKIFDFYVATHFVVWFVSALIIRDYYILHISSVLDELIELTFKDIRPLFAECWWDSIILDILLANSFGIYFGMKCIEWFGSQKYDWLGREGTSSFRDWKMWASYRYFQNTYGLLICRALNFLTAFTVGTCLWIPVRSNLSIIRLFIWFGNGALAFREAYDDARTWGTAIRVTKPIYAEYRWTTVMIQCCEMLVSWKFRDGGGNRLDQSIPTIALLFWSSCAVFGLSYWIYLRFFYKYRQHKDGTFMDKSIREAAEKKNNDQKDFREENKHIKSDRLGRNRK